jgi:hypothetical protein
MTVRHYLAAEAVQKSDERFWWAKANGRQHAEPN